MDIHLNLPIQRGRPVTQQIEETIELLIQSGQLIPGFQMPSTRRLSQQLGVHRKTVIEAYDRLQGKNLISTKIRKGTFINNYRTDEMHQVIIKGNKQGFEFRALDKLPGAGVFKHWDIELDEGYPDFQRGPFTELNVAYKRAFNSLRRKNDVIHNPDKSNLVKELSRLLLTQRGFSIDEEHTCFIRGCQMALYLIAQIVTEPGECIVMEDPCLALFRQSLAMSHARILTISQDKEGIDTAALQKLCRAKKVKAVLTYPHNHWPTAVTMSVARRAELVQLAKEYRFAIIEADLDGEFIYDGGSTRLISKDVEGNIIYLSCVSAMLPQLSFLCYVVGPAGFIQSLSTLWNSVDKQRDLILDRAVQELLRAGTIARYIRHSCSYYKTKRDKVAGLLDRYLAPYIEYSLPHRGHFFWLRLRRPVDVHMLQERLSKKGVYLQSVYSYLVNKTTVEAICLGFAASELPVLEQAFKMIAAEIKYLLRIKQ